MTENQLPQLPDLRETIHDLIIRHHTTGLSPPEEDALTRLESCENNMNDPVMIQFGHGCALFYCSDTS